MLTLTVAAKLNPAQLNHAFGKIHWITIELTLIQAPHLREIYCKPQTTDMFFRIPLFFLTPMYRV